MNTDRLHTTGRRIVTTIITASAVTAGGLIVAPTATAQASGTGAAMQSKSVNLIKNGGFERLTSTGVKPASWSTRGMANVIGGSHTGANDVSLVVDHAGFRVASVSQVVRIPSNARSATLRFWTQNSSCGADVRFDAHVRVGEHDRIVRSIETPSACRTPYAESVVPLNLNGLRGRSAAVTLSLTYKSGLDFSVVHLDDVSLLVS